MSQDQKTIPAAPVSAIAASPAKAAQKPFAAPPCPDDDPRFVAGIKAIRQARRETGNPVFSTKP